MILVTSFYDCAPERKKELLLCLEKNIQNIYLEKIFLLVTHPTKFTDSIFQHPKINQIIFSFDPGYRLTYQNAIEFINQQFENDLIIMANSDIYFDNTLEKVQSKDLVNHMYALLRYEDRKGKIILEEVRSDSQDAWIFKSPLKIPNTFLLNFPFGQLGCDNRFANLVFEAGITISNPCYDLFIYHVHESMMRPALWGKRLMGMYTFIPPCYLEDRPRMIHETKFLPT